MDTLVRLKLKPLGVWTTPWQADSLLGALANTWAREHGPDALRRDFLGPWLDREPLFVISDAFPGDSLPVPASLPLWWDWPPEKRKDVKKHRWVSPADFAAMQRGAKPTLKDSPPISIRTHVRLRNTISRATATTGEGGELFEVPFSNLSEPNGNLTLFARASSGGMQILKQSLEMLGQTGYGTDASVGHGGFELDDGPTPCPELDDVPGADGFISLSTFQPAATDPTEGFWRLFVKYGKLAPDFHHIALFKRPQVMLEAGACFHTGESPRSFYGGPIGPERLLSENARESLAAQGVRPVQAAFGLAVPMIWKKGS